MNGAYKRTDTTKLAVSALCLALTVAALVGASLIPGTEMTFYAIAGLFSGVVIMENGLKGGALVYVGALILSFILVPNKFAILPYGLFFGLYGFVKYFTEKIRKANTEILTAMNPRNILETAGFDEEELRDAEKEQENDLSSLIIDANSAEDFTYENLGVEEISLDTEAVK